MRLHCRELAARDQTMSINSPHNVRDVPARSIPVPDTVSAQMQAIIARPFDHQQTLAPTTAAEWKMRVVAAASIVAAELPKLRQALGVTVEPTTMAGVPSFIVTPKSIPPKNSERVLLHLHGGARVLYPGETGTW